MLTESGVVRQDITKSVGDASGVAEGVPTTVDLKLLDVAGGGGPLAGAAVYLWHCDREGRYSLYDESIAGENYLRGVQESRRRRHADVQDDLPGRLPGPLAAHPLRGLREPRRRDRGGQQAAHVAARDPAGRRARPSTRPPATSRACRTSRRPRWTPTWCSATATRASSRAVSGSVDDGLHALAQRRRLAAAPVGQFLGQPAGSFAQSGDGRR